MMHNTNKFIRLTIFLIVALAGCGYRFSGSGTFPAGVNHVFVKVLENETSESGIETTVTSNLINEFTLREKETFVGNIDEADSILSGAVSRIAFYTISAKGKDSAQERRVTVWVSLKLTDKNGSVIWAAKDLSDNEAYRVVEDKNVTERNKRVAIGLASRRIAERALNRLTDNF
jgi:outer membrane lipopolysaccharide assembly protein LptE/RlpB